MTDSDKPKVASKGLQTKILKAIEGIYMAKRNGNMKREQFYQEKLQALCQDNHMDYSDTLEKGRSVLRATVNVHGLRY